MEVHHLCAMVYGVLSEEHFDKHFADDAIIVSYSTCAVEIVIPRSLSSGALSILAKSVAVLPATLSDRTFVIDRKSVV